MLLPPPRTIDEGVIRFCSRISSEKPVYVPVTPTPFAVVSHCFDNVAVQIEKHGGNIAYGWAIWHWPSAYFEAEHHGVWRSPKGELIDITPGLTGAQRILFLPNQSAAFNASAFRSNVLVSIEGNQTAAEFVSLANAYNSTVDRYRGPGVIHPQLSSQDNLLVSGLLTRMAPLYNRLMASYPLTD
jgi:hypothetical protein